jgi:CubicO group peptidase (beta-lactamase class C family)
MKNGNKRVSNMKKRKTVKIMIMVIFIFLAIAMISVAIIYHIFSLKMKSMTLEERLQYTLEQVTDGEQIHGTVFSVYNDQNQFQWNGASGNLNDDSRYSIASVSKMFTVAVVMKLIENGFIGLNDPIDTYFSSEMIEGLHVFEGKDYSHDITILHLLSHTSGLPDYFTEHTSEDVSIAENRQVNHDVSYNIDDVLRITKALSPHFIPGSDDKAFYSDGNYQLLGYIIEKVTKKALSDVYREFIFDPLGLTQTYLQTNPSVWEIARIYDGETEIQVPAILASERSAGGIVSTAKENMLFLRSFFAGELFSKNYLEQMQSWNEIFFPMKYGMGIMKCALPIGSNYEIIGHSGSTGPVSYYSPAMNVFITGTTQQLDPVKALMVLYRLLFCFRFE